MRIKDPNAPPDDDITDDFIQSLLADGQTTFADSSDQDFTSFYAPLPQEPTYVVDLNSGGGLVTNWPVVFGSQTAAEVVGGAADSSFLGAVAGGGQQVVPAAAGRNIGDVGLGKQALRDKLTAKRHLIDVALVDSKEGVLVAAGKDSSATKQQSTKNAEQARKNRERKKAEEQRQRVSIDRLEKDNEEKRRRNCELRSRIMVNEEANEQLSMRILADGDLSSLLAPSSIAAGSVSSPSSGGVCIPIGAGAGSTVALCVECSKRHASTFADRGALVNNNSSFPAQLPSTSSTSVSPNTRHQMVPVANDSPDLDDLLNSTDTALFDQGDSEMPSM